MEMSETAIACYNFLKYKCVFDAILPIPIQKSLEIYMEVAQEVLKFQMCH